MSENLIYHQTSEAIESEKELILKAQHNPQDFAPLYDQYYLQLFNYVFKRVKEENDAAEITSDIFAKAIFNIKKYQFKGLPFSSWLYRIAGNEVINFYRQQKADKYVRVSENQLNYLIDTSKEEMNSLLDKEEKFDKITSSLEKLADDEQQLITMRFFEDRSFKEMSEILNTTETNARVKTHRAIAKVKELIKK